MCGSVTLSLMLLTMIGCTSDPVLPPVEYPYDLIFDGTLAGDDVVLLRARLDGTAVVPLAGAVVGRHASSDRDGHAMVYHFVIPTGGYILQVLHPGNAPVALAGAPGVSDREPEISPDGDRLVFTSHRDDEYGDIFTARLRGTVLEDVRNMTPGIGPEMTPTWSPDGTQIAFTSYRSGYPSIWIMSADGTALRQVTHGSSAFSDYFPSWSPDGTRLAFQRIGIDASRVGIVAVAGTPPVFLESSQSIYSPAWSPDGAYLAVAADDGDIHVLRPSGGFHQRVGSPGVDRTPAWVKRSADW